MQRQDYVSPSTKINSRWIKDLDVKPQTKKLLEENTGKIFQDIDMDKEFMDMTLKVQTTKSKLDKHDYFRLKSFCTVNDQQSGRNHLQIIAQDV